MKRNYKNFGEDLLFSPVRTRVQAIDKVKHSFVQTIVKL